MTTSDAHMAIQRALQEPTLADALSFIALWECERVISKAHAALSTENPPRDADGKAWDTAFKYLLQQVLTRYETESLTMVRCSTADPFALRTCHCGKAPELRSGAAAAAMGLGTIKTWYVYCTCGMQTRAFVEGFDGSTEECKSKACAVWGSPTFELPETHNQPLGVYAAEWFKRFILPRLLAFRDELHYPDAEVSLAVAQIRLACENAGVPNAASSYDVDGEHIAFLTQELKFAREALARLQRKV